MVVPAALGQLCSAMGPLVIHGFMYCAAIDSVAAADAPVLGGGNEITAKPDLRRYQGDAGMADDLVSAARRAIEQGDTDHAIRSLHLAVEMRERAWGRTHPMVAFSLDELARIHLAKGNVDRAASLIREAMDIIEDRVGFEDPAVIEPVLTMARARLGQGNVDASLWWLNRLLTLQEHQDEPFEMLGSGDAARARTRFSDLTMDLAVTLHVHYASANSLAAELALGSILRRKESALEARMQALAALRRLGADGQALTTQLKNAQDQLAEVVVKGRGLMAMQEYRARVSTFEERRKRLEAKLEEESLSGYVANPRPSSERLRNAIPEDAAFVEIVSYRPEFPARNDGIVAPSPRYVAYVLKREGGPFVVELGDAEGIDKQVITLRRLLGNPGRDPRPIAQALGERVMAPIARLLGDVRRVLVAPDGELSLLPLGALLDKEGHWYLEQFEFTYLSSGRDLIRSPIQRPSRGKAIIVAAPDFDHASPGPTSARGWRGVQRAPELEDVRFEALVHTETEARRIHALMPWMQLAMAGNASESLVKQLHGPEILHIATHGFFLRSSAKNVGSKHSAEREIWEDGFLRGGLAFAGANLRENETEDGVLTALEASTLDLDGTKLVVLSGCETGIGEVQARDGVRGLRHAFLTAGAQTLVTSLWPVDDEATQELMVAYYRALAKGQGRSEALRTAALETMRHPETKHPYVWAGFIVIGDGSRLDGTWSPAPMDVTLSTSQLHAQPEPVARGPRGCACRMSDEPQGNAMLGAGALIAASWIMARRRGETRALHERHKGGTRR